MTLRTQRPALPRGSTLVEMVAVMFIIAVMTGVAAGVVFAAGSYRLEAAEDAVVSMARRASRLATDRREVHAILVTPERCELLNSDGGSEISMEAPPDAVFKVLPYGAEDWGKPSSDGFLWRFEPSGLSLPVGISLSDGRNFWEIDFGALAGGVIERRSASYRD